MRRTLGTLLTKSGAVWILALGVAAPVLAADGAAKGVDRPGVVSARYLVFLGE